MKVTAHVEADEAHIIQNTLIQDPRNMFLVRKIGTKVR